MDVPLTQRAPESRIDMDLTSMENIFQIDPTLDPSLRRAAPSDFLQVPFGQSFPQGSPSTHQYNPNIPINPHQHPWEAPSEVVNGTHFPLSKGRSIQNVNARGVFFQNEMGVLPQIGPANRVIMRNIEMLGGIEPTLPCISIEFVFLKLQRHGKYSQGAPVETQQKRTKSRKQKRLGKQQEFQKDFS